MEKWISLLGDLCVIVFDLLLYIQMTTMRRNEARSRRILYAGSGVIVVFYILAVFVFSWPVSISTFVCMTLPSLAMFWLLSKHRDARFFLTFCFVDTVSMIIGYFVRYIGALFGNIGSILAIAIMLTFLVLVYRLGKPYLKRYREALDFIDTGWKSLSVSAAFIYITMIFIAAYPKPLIERPEYCVPYLFMSVMVLSCYAVFFTNIAVTRKVYDQSMQLKKQQKWFEMAYIDALTEIPNRMAYIERIHDLERMKDRTEPVAIVVIDLDNFKNINDTFGHSAGDDVLKQAAEELSCAFSDENSTVYRIGGDEFAAIIVGVTEDVILNKLESFGNSLGGSVPYSVSSGYSFIDSFEENAAERAFTRADEMMYANKKQKMSPAAPK